MSGEPTPRPRLEALARPRGAERFEDALRHRLRVKRLKILLPLAAIVCVAAIFLSLALNRREDVHIAGTDTPAIEMTAADLKGVGDNGKPYAVTAAHASQDHEGVIQLQDVKARIELDDGVVNLAAREGSFHPETGLANVSGGVEIDLDGAQHFRTERAEADMKAGRVVGKDPVRVEGPQGVIEAQGFTVEKSVRQVTFTGGVRSVIQPGAARGDSAPAPEETPAGTPAP